MAMKRYGSALQEQCLAELRKLEPHISSRWVLEHDIASRVRTVLVAQARTPAEMFRFVTPHAKFLACRHNRGPASIARCLADFSPLCVLPGVTYSPLACVCVCA